VDLEQNRQRVLEMPERYAALTAKYPLGSLLVGNAWPVGIGAAAGDVVASAADFRYPIIAAMLSGAVVQLLIALLRSLFSERRDVLATMREMLKERDESTLIRQKEEQRMRHELANRAHVAEMRQALLDVGVAREDLPPIKPLYNIDAEDRAEEARREVVARRSGNHPIG
jgi:hypothetical protein